MTKFSRFAAIFGCCLLLPWTVYFAPGVVSLRGDSGGGTLRARVAAMEKQVKHLTATRAKLQVGGGPALRSVASAPSAKRGKGGALCERLDLVAPSRAAELVLVARKARAEWAECVAPPTLRTPMHDQLGDNLAKTKRRSGGILLCPVIVCIAAGSGAFVPFERIDFAGVGDPMWSITVVGATTWLVFDQGRRMSMMAPYVYPRRATQLTHLPDNGVWSGTAPDIILATGYNLESKKIKDVQRKRAVSGAMANSAGGGLPLLRAINVDGAGTDLRFIDLHHRVDVEKRTGKWVDGVFWPFDVQPHTFQRGKWPFIVAANTEPWGCGSCKEFSVILDTKREQPASLWNCVTEAGAAHTTDAREDHSYGGCNTVHAPLFAMSFGDRSAHSVVDLLTPPDFDARATLAKKTHFAGFLANNCGMNGNEQKLTHATTRIAFFDMLSEYKPVTGLGACRKSADAPKVGRRHSGNFWDSSVKAYDGFKFVLTFDNMHSNGLVTEKLANALLSHAVPIYWGAPDLAQYGVDESAVVRCSFPTVSPRRTNWADFNEPAPDHADFETQIRYLRMKMEKDPGVKSCIKRVMALDQDDEAYIKALGTSFIGSKVEGSFADPLLYGSRIQGVMRSAQSTDTRGKNQSV